MGKVLCYNEENLLEERTLSIVTFYRGHPNPPKTTQGAHLGANVIIIYDDKILLEKRRDSDIWGLVGGGCKKTENGLRNMTLEPNVSWKEYEFERICIVGNCFRCCRRL